MSELADTTFMGATELSADLARIKPANPQEAAVIERARRYIDRTSAMLGWVRTLTKN